MSDALPRFADVSEMLRAWNPPEPVYCLYPQVYREHTRAFLDGFPGTVLYAVKANDEPPVLRLLIESGVRHFDCASLPEVALVKRLCPEATACFMIPARIRGAARAAAEQYGVRHFMIDHVDDIARLASEIPMADCVVFTRMAVHHASAVLDLSIKFGAPPEQVPGLLRATREAGAEPALAFNVGSAVRDPAAYAQALELAASVLAQLDFRIRLVDIGGGFPRAYPGFEAPPLEAYFEAVRLARQHLSLATGGEVFCEPGRALAAPGLSAVVEVLQRKEQRLYLNDGMYGAFWELRFGMQSRFPVRAFREAQFLGGETASFTLFGPTCDSTDVLPGAVELPRDLRAGDHLEFGAIGAYSLAGRTRFNGHYSERMAVIDGPAARPPGVA